MNADQKTVQYLTEAHALESALLQTLSAHLAMTPRGAYRSLLERHADETREHAERIIDRLADLGESRNAVQLVLGLAQTAVGQVVAAGKFPLDLLRGGGGEEKLLKNAKDEAASEALEIATYDALEALAEAAGDEETAQLAREHRAQEEAFLRDLRAAIPQLTRAVFAADVEDAPSHDASGTGAVAAARTAATEVRTAAERTRDRAEESVEDADLPIAGYDDLDADQVLPKLRLLTAAELARVERHERDGRARKRVLDRIAKLREQTNGRRPMPAR